MSRIHFKRNSASCPVRKPRSCAETRGLAPFRFKSESTVTDNDGERRSAHIGPCSQATQKFSDVGSHGVGIESQHVIVFGLREYNHRPGNSTRRSNRGELMQSLAERQRNERVICTMELQQRTIHFRNVSIGVVSILKHQVHREPWKLPPRGFNPRRKRGRQNQPGRCLISATLNRRQLYTDSAAQRFSQDHNLRR